jgi:hypothetical protein
LTTYPLKTHRRARFHQPTPTTTNHLQLVPKKNQRRGPKVCTQDCGRSSDRAGHDSECPSLDKRSRSMGCFSHGKMASTDHLPIDAEQQQTFNGFRKLPTEIRLMIWHMALPGPRVITIQQRTTVERWQRGCLSAGYLIPSTLHTSHEARQVALRNYQLAFAQNYI